MTSVEKFRFRNQIEIKRIRGRLIITETKRKPPTKSSPKRTASPDLIIIKEIKTQSSKNNIPDEDCCQKCENLMKQIETLKRQINEDKVLSNKTICSPTRNISETKKQLYIWALDLVRQ